MTPEQATPDDPTPTHEQIENFFSLIASGKINKYNLQTFFDSCTSPAQTTRYLPEDYYAVTVDYNVRLFDMIARGKYDYYDPNIKAENFPINFSGRSTIGYPKTSIRVEMVHYNQSVNAEFVLSDLESRNMRPVNLAELLAFDAQYPNRNPGSMMCLGSLWHSNIGTMFPFLSENRFSPDRPRRGLGLSCLGWTDGLHYGNVYYLAVRLPD